jgi:hypothetical protein
VTIDILNTSHPIGPDAQIGCANKVELFMSTQPEAHQRARAICKTCPALLACRKTTPGPTDHFEGTWAGLGYGIRTERPRRKTPDQLAPINHGTVGGASKHRRLDVPMCEPCADALSAYQHNYKRDPGYKRPAGTK